MSSGYITFAWQHLIRNTEICPDTGQTIYFSTARLIRNARAERRRSRVTSSTALPYQGKLRFRYMPHTFNAIAGLVARLLILKPVIKWLALQRPLLLAIISFNQRQIAAATFTSHRKVRSNQWWPVLCTRSIASALATASNILIKYVKRHTIAASNDIV